MGRQFTWIFLGVSAAFFLFITGLTGYRIDAARRANEEQSRDRAAAFAARARQLAAGPGGFAGAAFKEGMRRDFEADGRLLLAAVRSEGGGFLWLMARDLGILAEPSVPTAEWRGTPVYRLKRGSQALVSRPLAPSDASAGVVYDGVYAVLGRDDLYPVLRDDLYLFLAFLLASGIFMLLTIGYPQPASTPAPGVEGALPAPGSFASRIPADDPDARGRSLTSPASGLVWAEHLPQRLKAEIERAAASDLDLSFARIVVDAPAGSPAHDAGAAEVARQLRATFPVADLLFESGPGSFSVVLPDQDLDQAIRTLEAFRSRLASPPSGGARVGVSVGVSARGGRLIEENTLLVEAEIAAAKAAREGGNRVVGFRADPARFRAALGSA